MDSNNNNSNGNPPIFEDSASKSKLCIKLKIPTREEAEEEDYGSSLSIVGRGGGSSSSNFQLQPGHRVCEFCGKEFSSGKAWGGHKRHHLKMMKNSGKRIQEIPNNNIKIKKYSGGGGPGKSDSGGSGFKIVSRAGCNMIKAGDVIMGSDGKPTCHLCRKVFGSLSSLFGHLRNHPDGDWKRNQSPLNSNSREQSFPFVCSRFRLNQINQNQICSGSDDAKNIDLVSSLSSLGWSKKDRRGRVCLSDSIPQAAHSLLTLSRGMTMEYATSGSATATDEFQAHETEEEEEDEEAMESCFQCDICERTFSTGQALGGHKRCHRKAAAKPNELISVAFNTASSEEPFEAGHGMLDIDLNKPYEDEDGFNDED